MTEPTIRNSSFNTLSFVLKDNTGVHVLAYGAEHTFAELWGAGLESRNPEIGGQQINWDDGTTVVLIVGEAAPDEVFKKMPECLNGINFRDHLTAPSWAAAWRLRFPNAKARVVVVGSSLEGTGSSIALALGTLFGARDANNSPLVPGVSLLRSPSLEVLCKTLGANNGEVIEPTPIVQTMLRSTLWDDLTSDREKNHAVSNVLGALLLRSQVRIGRKHEGEPWPEDYLLALVKACKVTADAHQIDLGQGRNSGRWISTKLQSSIGAAVLLDDMADIWEWFLVGALGFVKESFVTSPNGMFLDESQKLPSRLTGFLNSKRHFLTADVLISGQHRVKEDFVLFLDLRLFPKRGSTGSDLQGPFLKELANFGLVLLKSGRNLPWLDESGIQLLQKELDRFVAEVSPQPSSSSALILPPEETLLPRLLSLLDPTLPIVIFSSTHRSELIDPFRNYANIITTFRKPILAGMTRDWVEVVKDLHADFVSALEQASAILRTRHDFAGLAIAEPVCSPRQPRNGNGRIIEIYIDESGDPFSKKDPGFAVGGIILQHDDLAAQKDFHKAINQSPKKWGVSDYEPDRIKADEVGNKLPLVSYYPKKPMANSPEETEGLDSVSSALGEKTRIAAFALIEPDILRLSKDDRLNSAIFFDRNSLDNIFYILLRTNLELLLFEHPWIDLKADSLFIHVATRQQYLVDYSTHKIWQEAYGIEFKLRERRWSYTSLGADSVFRLVREVLQSRGSLEWRPKIVMARGVTLNDYDDIVLRFNKGDNPQRVNSQLYNPTGPDPKQIHYLADWIVRMSLYRYLTSSLPACTEEWFKAGYIQAMTPEFALLLSACRMEMRDEAITRLSRLSLTSVNELRMGKRAERYLRQTVSTWPSSLGSDELRSLFKR